MQQIHYEESDYFDGRRYKESRHGGVAWRVLGWETEPDEDTEWSGYEVRTGNVVCHMIGDDRLFSFDIEDLEEINRDDYCGVCGQIGCCHDGR